MQGVVSLVCTRTITVNVPGVTRFLNEKLCASILKEMETKFTVLIIPKHVPWESLAHQVKTERRISAHVFVSCVFQPSPQEAGQTSCDSS